MSMQAVFPCLVKLWDSPKLSQLNPKVVELLIATVKHLYSNEKLIESKLAEFFKSTSPATGKGTAAAKEPVSGGGEGSGEGASAPSAPPPPPIYPSVDPVFLQQLCDMGFTREQADEALTASANDLPAAMDWILNHPQTTTASATTVS